MDGAQLRRVRARSLSTAKAPTGGYTIDDHPHLLTARLREVFEAFRKQVLALDPV